jgi:CRP-like cAMP-binding protein
VETIKLLRDCDELDFVWGLVKFANRNKWDREDLIYNQGDIAESLFFIYRGKVKLKGKSGKTAVKYRQGDTIGESDSLLGEERDAKAVAAEPCVLYQVETDHLQELFDRFPEQHENLLSHAELKRETHLRRIKQIDKNYGKISDQAARRL